MPKVSIIIPVYNVEEYLKECLDSVINQTLKDIEIVCVNDCSTDNSLDILEEYAKNDGRIVIIQNEKNSGLSYSRNVGIKAAQGEYIQFLDSDDYLLEDTVELFYGISKENNLDILKSGYLLYNVMRGTVIRVEGNNLDGIYTGKELLFEMEKNRIRQWQAWINFIKREFILENKLKFYDNILHEDLLFTYELCLHAQRSMYVPECKYVYRKRPLSITTVEKTSKHLYGYILSMSEVLKKGFGNSDSLKFKYATMAYFARMYRNGQSIRKQIESEIDTSAWEQDVVLLYNMLFQTSINTYLDFSALHANLDKITSYDKVFIYGAGKAAEELVRTLQNNDVIIDGVAVTDVNKSNKALFGHKVHNIDDYLEYKNEALVLVAITPKYVDDVLQSLKEKGFENVIYMCAGVN